MKSLLILLCLAVMTGAWLSLLTDDWSQSPQSQRIGRALVPIESATPSDCHAVLRGRTIDPGC